MKKKYFLPFLALTLLIYTSCASNAINIAENKNDRIQSIVYFNPEVFPDIVEIKEPTYAAFYAAMSEKLPQNRNFRMLRVDSSLDFDEENNSLIKEFCSNNDANFAIVPKVKYFKVGIGKYVFSNQVVVSMKLFDASGNFLMETDYDTYKKNARILGSAENSIKIGTNGALKNLGKILHEVRKS